MDTLHLYEVTDFKKRCRNLNYWIDTEKYCDQLQKDI